VLPRCRPRPGSLAVGRVRHVETSANPNGPLVFFRGTYASLADQDLPACG